MTIHIFSQNAMNSKYNKDTNQTNSNFLISDNFFSQSDANKKTITEQVHRPLLSDKLFPRSDG